MNFQPHQKRVVEEQQELQGRIERLETFVAGSIFPTLEQEDRELMMNQLAIMRQLNEVLEKRISRFK